MHDYAADIARCNARAQQSADDCARMVRFVLATIQQGLETVPAILDEFETVGELSPFAFQSKRAGLRWLGEHAGELYRDAIAARDNPGELMRVFLRVPGVGLVKAGFCCQLFAGSVGCLDVHNIRMYGLAPRAFDSARYKNAKREATRQRVLGAYLDTCAQLGGAVELWARWCEYKAELSPTQFASGAEVSALHWKCIEGAIAQPEAYAIPF